MGAEIHAKAARDAQKAAREADRAEFHMVIRKEGYGGPAQPSATTSASGWTARLFLKAKTLKRIFV